MRIYEKNNLMKAMIITQNNNQVMVCLYINLFIIGTLTYKQDRKYYPKHWPYIHLAGRYISKPRDWVL